MAAPETRDQIVEELHRLIDRLPEDALKTIGMMVALATAPRDDEPTTPEEDSASDEAWQEYLRGEAIAAEGAKRRLLGRAPTGATR